MRIIIEVIDYPASNSFLRNNLNPLRVGLMLYRLVDEVTRVFNYSAPTSKATLDKIQEQLTAILEIYIDPKETCTLIEMPDYDGNDIFWYLDKYDLYDILNCRILDRIIQNKWNGPYDLNATIMDYSTGFSMIADPHDVFATDLVFQEIQYKMYTVDRSHLVHGFKFEVWKRSMQLRQAIDLVSTLLVTFYFQYGLVRYTQYEIESSKVGRRVLGKRSELLADYTEYEILAQPDYAAEVALLKKDFTYMGDNLNSVMIVSFINLLFPLNIFGEYILTSRTHRAPSSYGPDFFNELTLFILTIVAQVNMTITFRKDDQENPFHSSAFGFDGIEKMAATIVWNHINHNNYFPWVLAILSINTWVKVIIKMQATPTFGPTFKVILAMGSDLALFYMLWAIILMSLTSVSCIIFMSLPEYEDFWSALYMHFEFALGAFDSSIFCQLAADLDAETTTAGHRSLAAEGGTTDEEYARIVCTEGRLFMLVFNSANMVLLLNLIIAILSSTYAFYEDKKIGLFYEVLVSKFNVMEFDERYGSCACAQPPMNLMIFPLQWVVIFRCFSDNFLRMYNELLCHLLYLPLATIFTSAFLVVDLVSIPFAYVIVSLKLLQRTCEGGPKAVAATGHQHGDPCQHTITFFKFLLLGPIVLLATIPMDCYIFAYNLYTKPPVEHEKSATTISLSSLDSFAVCLDAAMKEKRRYAEVKTGTSVEYRTLNKILQKKFDVYRHFRDILFANHSVEKFRLNKETGKHELIDPSILHIKVFNQLKLLVARCAHKDGQVDTELLRALINQVNLRKRMLMIASKYMKEDVFASEDQLAVACLFEFATCDPNAVESTLAVEGQVIEECHEKLIAMHEGVLENAKDLMNRMDKAESNIAQRIASAGIPSVELNRGPNVRKSAVRFEKAVDQKE